MDAQHTDALFQVSGRVSYLSDRIIVAMLLGPRAVVPFYITQRLAELVQQQLLGIGNASWAPLADLYARGMLGAFNTRLVQLTRLTTVLAVATLVPIAVFNEGFVGLWVGSQRYGGAAVTVLACVHAYLLAVSALWVWCFSGTGQVERVVKVSAVMAMVNVATSVVLTFQLGLAGPLLGSVLSLGLIGLIGLTVIPRLLLRTFQTAPSALASAVVPPLLLGAPFAGLAVWIEAQRAPTGWIELPLFMAAAATAYLAAAWFTMFDREERTEYASTVRAMLRRNRGT